MRDDFKSSTARKSTLGFARLRPKGFLGKMTQNVVVGPLRKLGCTAPWLGLQSGSALSVALSRGSSAS
ncbi:hypothetical protein D8674_038671 [Pyrus ussuriensis x Pyrus communis]|uniref:Uncharacterized protein n=1 Tax=Pyrus ussuriensis x Pyrus communis TaxID=2448454 RepID=A0A5N5I0F5_9ROSA|nr:hypothetical protein D8674_038671 [Pyrus ussuriensis x Pyrus communis]